MANKKLKSPVPDRVIATLKRFDVEAPVTIRKNDEELLQGLIGLNNSIEQYVGNLTRKYPECFMKINKDIIEESHEVTTDLRGKYILEQLKAYRGQRPIPENLYDWIKPIKGDAVLDSLHDAWGNYFVVEDKGSFLELKSKGSDDKNPKKTFVVGKISWQ
jgi:hypothetical protein